MGSNPIYPANRSLWAYGPLGGWLINAERHIGPVAQTGERYLRTVEVVGSIPARSTGQKLAANQFMTDLRFGASARPCPSVASWSPKPTVVSSILTTRASVHSIMDKLREEILALVDWACDENGQPDEKKIKAFLELPMDETDENTELIIKHDWRKLTPEEIAENPQWYQASSDGTSNFRKCKNCGLTIIPGGGMKAGHGYCNGIIVRKVMDD